MAKKLQLQIPTPCHENWENMTATDKGRFCASCQKQVIDFSNKSDREIAMFFKKPSTGSVCGRFMGDQLNREIDIPKKRIPWLKYFFQFLIPAFFISYRANAQGKVKVITTSTTQSQRPLRGEPGKKSQWKIAAEVCTRIVGDTTAKYVPKSDIDLSLTIDQIQTTFLTGFIGEISLAPLNVIKGKVIDEQGNPIAFANISIKGTENVIPSETTGMFSISPSDDWKKVTLVASAIGFEPVEIKIARPRYYSPDTILLIPMKLQATGEVVVVGFPSRKTKKQKAVPLLQRIFKDTAFSKFRIYPNPVTSNSTLNIEWKQKERGDHLLQLFNQSGQLMLSREIYIDEKTKLFSISMPSITSGNYVLRLTSKVTGRSYSENLIID